MTSNKSESGTSDSVFLGPPRKKSRLECKFGMKCYRKNPTHFEEFNHCHLNDIIAKWEDENSLPPDVDSELLKISSVVLDQLKIVRECQPKSGMQGGGPISSSSSQGTYVKPHQSEFSAHEEGDIQKINKDPKTVDRQRGSNCTVSKQEQMIREATKHHGDVQAKIDAAAPYNFFLTSVADSPQTHKEHLSITFTELLDKSLGELESSLQINFMVELGWLLAQYFYTGNRFKPMTLLYGVEDEELQEGKKLPSNITAIKVKPPTAFGHHHTKMTVLSYKDKSLRVIISTANLVESDWVNRTQGLWVSPKLPQLPADADTISGESPTCFKGDLLRYLAAYRLPQLQTWLAQIRRTDFSSIRVFLVASVPGTHYGPEVSFWGHRRLKSLLKENIADPKDRRFPWSKWPIIGQFSSIGTLGPDPNSWLCGEWKASVSAPSKPLEDATVKLIYPSLDNVKGSHDGLLGGACLPYQKKIHAKQEWLTAYLHQWQSSVRFRTRAMPHSKSYARVSPCSSFMSWFLLTSANLSKAAWGTETKSKLPGPGLRILSYEAGVLFLPKLLVEDNIFNLSENNNSANIQKAETGKRNEYPPFPIHYDLPLHTYKSGDSPFFYDVFKDD